LDHSRLLPAKQVGNVEGKMSIEHRVVDGEEVFEGTRVVEVGVRVVMTRLQTGVEVIVGLDVTTLLHTRGEVLGTEEEEEDFEVSTFDQTRGEVEVGFAVSTLDHTRGDVEEGFVVTTFDQMRVSADADAMAKEARERKGRRDGIVVCRLWEATKGREKRWDRG